jgi:hypothetical protein
VLINHEARRRAATSARPGPWCLRGARHGRVAGELGSMGSIVSMYGSTAVKGYGRGIIIPSFHRRRAFRGSTSSSKQIRSLAMAAPRRGSVTDPDPELIVTDP